MNRKFLLQSFTDLSVAATIALAAPGSARAEDGTIKVKKLTVASDVGTAVNPDGVRAQTASGLVLHARSVTRIAAPADPYVYR